MVADILNKFFSFIVHLSFQISCLKLQEFVVENGDGSSVLHCASRAF